MELLSLLVAVVVGIGSLICWVMVLIQMFKTQGPLHGILGIICGLYAFIWGWMKAKELHLSTIMMAWTACIVLAILVNVLATAMLTARF